MRVQASAPGSGASNDPAVLASDSLRRDYNEAWFKQIFIRKTDGQVSVAPAERTDAFQELMTAKLNRDAAREVANRTPARQRNRPAQGRLPCRAYEGAMSGGGPATLLQVDISPETSGSA